MIVLGLHKDPWHNTGAAAVRDDRGELEIAFISEERLDRVKDSRGFPQSAVDVCLRQIGVDDIGQVDLVVLDYIRDGSDWRRDHFRTPARTDVFLDSLPADRIHIINHHLCHAAATFYSSDFDEAAVLVIDGRGSDHETQSLFRAGPDGIELLESTDTIGIGLLYATVTQAIGFGLLQEGKTMGLAPFGAAVDKAIFDFRGRFDGIVTDYGAVCREGEYAFKVPYHPICDFDDQARGAWEVQQECERAMLHLAAHARERTGLDNLCISGGVGLNSVANNRVLRSGIFKDIFINPACSDTGIPLGAALYGYHRLLDRPRTYAGISPFTGPRYSAEQIDQAIDCFDGYRVIRDNARTKVVDLLCDNLIVGHFNGRSEMGPRALGNRSILMSPLKADNKDVLNLRVKHREPFRPFAPAVLEDRYNEFFVLDRPSPYMLLVPDVAEDKRDVIPAVTHVDGTARVQTVNPERNPGFYDVIRNFGDATGVPVLLNTSFNVAGEPIVETPEDAIRCFLGTNIDALLLEDVLLVKDGVESPA